MEKCIIVAVADNWGIGVKGDLPWHISEDLKYFKAVTAGFPVIMGRTTYFSLPFHPLKGRKNIVLNLGGDPIPEATCVYSFDEAFAEAEATGAEKCFIMGGASVYKAAISMMDRLYITHVHTVVENADVFFPQIDPAVWEEESRSETHVDPQTGFPFEFVVYRRR
ncbi:MAG: dihydrofolate reductase [Bacteroidales bacterium]|nr:dihydrofolate reductase [Bacteroidales bacterium]